MVDIYYSVNFFRNFGDNVLLGKNTLKTRKRILSDDHTDKQGLVPRLLRYRSYFICKNLPLAKFLCNLKILERSYTELKKAKNAIFAKMAILKWLYSSITT